VAAVLEILDVASLNSHGAFEIGAGFRSGWRAHVWEGNLFLVRLKFNSAYKEPNYILQYLYRMFV